MQVWVINESKMEDVFQQWHSNTVVSVTSYNNCNLLAYKHDPLI